MHCRLSMEGVGHRPDCTLCGGAELKEPTGRGTARRSTLFPCSSPVGCWQFPPALRCFPGRQTFEGSSWHLVQRVKFPSQSSFEEEGLRLHPSCAAPERRGPAPILLSRMGISKSRPGVGRAGLGEVELKHTQFSALGLTTGLSHRIPASVGTLRFPQACASAHSHLQSRDWPSLGPLTLVCFAGGIGMFTY